MNAKEKLRVEERADELARILYEEADKSQIQTLAGIEECVRAQALAHLLPRIGAFFCGGSRRQAAKPEPLSQERFRRIEADRPTDAKARRQAARRPKSAAGAAGASGGFARPKRSSGRARAGELIAALPPPNRLRRFLEKQRTRRVDYEDFQRADAPIGSGAVEAAIKQTGARIKTIGARWKQENVNSALANPLAYLNSKQMLN